MANVLRRLGALATRLTRRPGRNLVDVAFDGGYHDPTTSTIDHGGALRANAPVGRVRWRRRDVAAALRAGAPDRELVAWPPVASREDARRAC